MEKFRIYAQKMENGRERLIKLDVETVNTMYLDPDETTWYRLKIY